MKCKNILIQKYTKKGKKNGLEVFCYLPEYMTEDTWDTFVAEKAEEDGVVCGGELVVKVESVEEPYYGGVSASLSVEVKCLKCKHPTFRVIDETNVERILTEYVQRL